MSSIDDVRGEVADALGISPGDIGDHDDLIGLGLDSIRIMKIAGGWRKRGHRLNFAQLAAEPSVSAWAARLAESAPAEPSTTGQASTGPASIGDEPGGSPAAAADTPVAEPAGTAGADTGGDPADGDTFPLAPMQHAFWIGRTDVADLGGVAAHLYVEFDGAGIDPVRLRAAARQLVELHPMLRAQFLPDGTQRVLVGSHDPLDVQDLTAATAAQAEATLARTRTDKSHQILDVGAGEVIDLTVTLLPDGRHRLHLDVDMLAADAMSYRQILTDLAALYDGAAPTPTEFTYRDYLRHRAAHPDPALAADRQWWQERLDDLPLGPTLPTAAEAARSNRVVRHHRWLDPQAKERVLAGAHQRGVTPAIALAAIFAATIRGWSNDDRFLLNVPLFHREPIHPDVERISGDFSSSVLIDVDTTDTEQLVDLARSMQETMHANGSHASYGALDVLRDLGRHRGEQVLAPVVYTSALGLGELFAEEVLDRFGEPTWIISQGPQVMLDAQVTEVRGGLLLNWDVRADAFPDGVVEAMFDRYTSMIDAVVADTDSWSQPVRTELPAAQRAVRDRVNDTATTVTPRALHAGFFETAETEPARTALIARSGSSSYGELAAEALRVAAALTDAGARPGDAVAVQIPKGPAQVVATLGVFGAGCIWVPIAHDHPVARRDRIFGTGGIGFLLAADTDLTGLPVGVVGLDLEAARAHHRSAQPHFPDPESVAYVLFTSGSTGTPKGVEVSHRAAMNTIADINERFAVGETDRSITVAALEFDISVYDIFGLYSAGGAVVAVDRADARDPASWVDLIRTHDVSILTCVPSALDMLITAAEFDPAGLGTSLRATLLGGDWVGADLPSRLRALVPDARFAGLGGATEIAIHGTVCEVVGDPPPEWTAVPFGTPLHNVVCRVVDVSGRDCPDWVTGELWVGGAGVAHGYRNDAGRTAERFVTVGGTRWYRTGDLARYWPDGTIEFLGRADHQVKIRGFRVELGEVEGALRSLPQLRHAVAAVVDAGGAARSLAAAVTLEPATPGEVTPDAITAALTALLPAHMVPTRIEIVDEIPLTANGKSDRKAIHRLLADAGAATERVAPADDLERALQMIVAEVLSARTEDIGVTDDFFAVGGDSVLATTVVARIRDWLDAPHVGVADIFATKTIRDLARRIDAADERPGRLRQVAAVYLEIAAMDDALVDAEISGSTTR